MHNQELLKQYSNFDNTKNILKVFVSYIKPSFLFKNDILLPIHLGKDVAKVASKDGTITQEDLDWLNRNCISDNDCDESISKYNRRVGFLTGTFWAYKNYEQLNNPKYFGSFGYRKLLLPNFLNELEKYDAILPKKTDFKIETLKTQFNNYHGYDLYSGTIKLVEKIYPNEIQNIEKYFNGTFGYFYEIYILKKDIFFDFCEWIFPILFEFINMDKLKIKQNDTRDIGFIMERLTGYYLYKVSKKYNIFEADVVITQKMTINKQNINSGMLSKLRKKFNDRV